MTDYFAISDSYSIDFPVIDISCIILPYDVSFLSFDISCNELPIDLSWNIIDNSCNSALWFSLDVSFILMDISTPNIVSIDISYGLENNRMVFFSHENDN
jgi:hypothetical protein